MAALRLLHYAPQKSDVENGVFGAGAHTDYGMQQVHQYACRWIYDVVIVGLLTLLSTDDNPGLEIFYEGHWHSVPVRKDAFVVNIGDMTERWTNGLFRSTRHRVVNKSGTERFSAPFFYEPNFDCLVKVFQSCVSEDHPSRYPPTTSGQHLLDKYRKTHADFKTNR